MPLAVGQAVTVGVVFATTFAVQLLAAVMVTVIGFDVAVGDVQPVPVQLVNLYPAAGVKVTETGVVMLNLLPETGLNVPLPAGLV
jgi:hypothetical protein